MAYPVSVSVEPALANRNRLTTVMAFRNWSAAFGSGRVTDRQRKISGHAEKIRGVSPGGCGIRANCFETPSRRSEKGEGTAIAYYRRIQEACMSDQKETRLAPRASTRDPFGMLRQMRSDFDRMFDDSFWPSLRGPSLQATALESLTWFPTIEVFEKDNRLVTKVDLPGLKKEDVKVEVTDSHLAISGERKREKEEEKKNVYRCERDYGSFYRVVPLPDGVKLDDIKATFADGVLEVSVPLRAQPEAKVRKIEIREPAKASKSAA
jgi:HSP20 family protein